MAYTPKPRPTSFPPRTEAEEKEFYKKLGETNPEVKDIKYIDPNNMEASREPGTVGDTPEALEEAFVPGSIRGLDDLTAPSGNWRGESQIRHSIKTLGPAVHRRIYGTVAATAELGDKATEEDIERHAKDWDNMPESSKIDWQTGPGRQATKTALENHAKTYVQSDNAKRVQVQNTRKIAVKAALGGSDAAEHFKSTGQLLTPQGEPERNWKNGWIANLTSSSVLNKGREAEGVALHNDPQYHEGMSNHIEGLARRASSVSSPNLQQGQFGNVADQHANAAREALAGSAMAHSLGMKDLAVGLFRQANTHAKNLAQHIATTTNSSPMADWKTGDTKESDYIASVNPKTTAAVFGRRR